MAEELRDGDQPLPVPNSGDSMHDRAIERLERAIARLRDRKGIGFERYDSLLQEFNGRDYLRDLAEELGDATAYVEGVIAERDALAEKIRALPRGDFHQYRSTPEQYGYESAVKDVLQLLGVQK